MEKAKTTEEFCDEVFQAVLGAQAIQAAWLGDKLGWYKCLAGNGPMTTTELAERTHSSERYAREWCEHQTMCGWIACEDPSSKDRRFYLTQAQTEVLTNQDSLCFYMPLAKFVGNLGRHVDKLQAAYQTDGGLSWQDMGADAREGQAEMNRPMFLQLLAKEFIPTGLPAVDKKLKASGRVADIGAGMSWSSIGVAQAYPNARVDAFDLDSASVQQANKNIRAAGLEDRVTSQCQDVGAIADPPKYDLVMACECIHDMGDPVSVLASMKKLAGENGTVMIMDEKVQYCFTGDETDLVERFMYGFSITCCLADCKSHPKSAETGTVMRPNVLEGYAKQAGFESMEILPIENDMFRFYHLKQ